MSQQPIPSPAGEAAPDRAALRTLPREWQGFVQLAATLCQAPLAALVLKDEGLSIVGGAPAGALERLLREQDPFEAATLECEDVFEVPNVALDPRFSRSTCATGALALRAYAGCAVRGANGETLGRLAVYGIAARRLTPAQRQGLKALAEQCAARLELRARLTELELLGGAPAATSPARSDETAAGAAPATDHRMMNPHVTGAPPEDAAVLAALLDSAPVAIYRSDVSAPLGYVNRAYRRMFHLSAEQTVDDWSHALHPEDRERMEREWAQFCRDPRQARFEYRTVTPGGDIRFYEELVV